MKSEKSNLFASCFETTFGKMLAVVNDAQELCLLYFIGSEEAAILEVRRTFPHCAIEWNSVRCTTVIQQLNEYFAGERKEFSLKLALGGTEFQNEVWRELLKTPYGTTATYGELAAKLGKPSYSRAVGAANGANRIAVVIPCHRIVGANGKLTGYAYGVDLKARLLSLEQGF